MSEHNTCETSIEIHGQHLQVRLNGRSLFNLYRPLSDSYQLTLEQEGGRHTIWMRQSCNGSARLFSTEDFEQAKNVMTVTADGLQRMAMNETQEKTLRRRGVVWLIPTGAMFVFLVGAWVTWLINTPAHPKGHFTPTAELSSINTADPILQPMRVSPTSVGAPEPIITAKVSPPTKHISLSAEEATEARKILASRLKNGAAKKAFTVSLSSGHLRTLYVFADPACENCRIFEPTVQALSEQYNVEIFPVTLIGKTRTAERVMPLMCAPAEKRADMWRGLFDVGADMLNPTEKAGMEPSACEAGQNALARNDLAFELYKLPGTPTVISDDGRLIPLQAMTSDSALQAFLNSVP